MPTRVLIVDDDPQVATLLRLQLDANGYASESAESGEEAIRIAVERPPGVILLDVGLPGMSGFEVLERLRAIPSTCRIPVVMLTGAGSPDDIVRGYASGAVYYVPKPYALDELLRGLRLALGR